MSIKFSKSKWLAYTFLVGLIPVLTRFITWLTTTPGSTNPLTASDFVAFGLVLHISVINEIERIPAKEKEWKTIQNGTSILFVTIYSAIYALTIIGEKNGSLIDTNAMLNSCITLSLVSSLISYSVFDRLSKLHTK